MSSLYLPISSDNFKNNKPKIYDMKYNKDVLNEFLDYVKVSYQDKYIYGDLTNNLKEYNKNPLLYTVLFDMIQSEVLDLRFLGVYMGVNFKEKMPNNYTENDKDSILLQLKNDETIFKDINLTNKEEISNIIYEIELYQISKNLTIGEKAMSINDFENLVFQFFDLFDIQKVKLKRNYMEYIMAGKDEVASINSDILSHDSFQKVYKKIF